MEKSYWYPRLLDIICLICWEMRVAVDGKFLFGILIYLILLVCYAGNNKCFRPSEKKEKISPLWVHPIACITCDQMVTCSSDGKELKHLHVGVLAC